MMSTDVQNDAIGSSPDCWTEFRQWLLNVLPLRHDAGWFCADVNAISGTFSDAAGSGNADSLSLITLENTNKSLAVLQWLIQNPLCNNPGLQEEYINTRGSQRSAWINTQDTSLVKLDTTLPSMHDLGLDSVLKYAALLGVQSVQPESIISSAFAIPNPTTSDGVVISFTTSREAYVKLDIYDLLGVEVSSSSNFGNVLEAGNHQVPMSLAGLPSGTYYVRIMTTYGEVQTVKIVKE
jgi:hypothetical protein